LARAIFAVKQWDIPSGGTALIAGPQDNMREVLAVQEMALARHVVAVELIPETAEKLRLSLEKYGIPDVDVINASIADVPQVKDGSVQFFFASGITRDGKADEVFGEALARTVLRVLAPGGIAFIQVKSMEMQFMLAQSPGSEVVPLANGLIVAFKKAASDAVPERTSDMAMLNMYRLPAFYDALGVRDVATDTYMKLKVRDVTPESAVSVKEALKAVKVGGLQQEKWDALSRWFDGHPSNQRMLVVDDPKGGIAGALVFGWDEQRGLVIYTFAVREDRYDFLRTQIQAWTLNNYMLGKKAYYYNADDFGGVGPSMPQGYRRPLDVDLLRLEHDLLKALHADEWKNPSARQMLMELRGHQRITVSDKDRLLARRVREELTRIYDRIKAVHQSDEGSFDQALAALDRETIGVFIEGGVRIKGETFGDRFKDLFPALARVDWKKPVPPQAMFEVALGKTLLIGNTMLDGVSMENWLLTAFKERFDPIYAWLNPVSDHDKRWFTKQFGGYIKHYWDVPNLLAPLSNHVFPFKIDENERVMSLQLFDQHLTHLLHIFEILIFPFLDHLADPDTLYVDVVANRGGKVFMLPWPVDLENGWPMPRVDEGVAAAGRGDNAAAVRWKDDGSAKVDLSDGDRKIVGEVLALVKEFDQKLKNVRDTVDKKSAVQKVGDFVIGRSALSLNERMEGIFSDFKPGFEMPSRWGDVSFAGAFKMTIDQGGHHDHRGVSVATDLSLMSKYVADAGIVADIYLDEEIPLQVREETLLTYLYKTQDGLERVMIPTLEKLILPENKTVGLYQAKGPMGALFFADLRPFMPELKDAAQKDLGGIDFNTDRVALNETGDVPVPAMSSGVIPDVFYGFKPMIRAVSPVASVRALFN
jgi:hypothetical protein